MVSSKRRRRERMKRRAAEDILPIDCWEKIFRKVDEDKEWYPISSVCKTFLSITNRMRRKLNFFVSEYDADGHNCPDTTAPESLQRLMARFPGLVEIHLIVDYFDYHYNILKIFGKCCAHMRRLQSLHFRCRCHTFLFGPFTTTVAAAAAAVDRPSNIGLEAPRNSFELQAETCQRNGAAGDVPVEEDWQEEGCYPVEASMKKLINDELSKHCNTRPNGPSIVARLMGMDMLPVDTKPVDTKPVVQLNDNKNESKGVKLSKKGKSRRGSVGLDLSKPDSPKIKEFDSFYDHVERDADCRSSLKKPMPREHPQEEELQMFKKEFLAWQAARFKEYAKVADISEQFIAQETLNMRKMELYSMSQRTTNEKPIEIEGLARNKPQYSGGLQNNKNKVEVLLTDQKNCLPLINKTLTRDLKESDSVNCDLEFNRSSVPTKIVILKPGPEKISYYEDSWTSSSSTLEKKGIISSRNSTLYSSHKEMLSVQA